MNTDGATARAAAEAPPAPAEAMPLRVTVGYGVGGVLDQWGMHGLKNTAHPVLNLVLGMNPAFIGLMLAIARIWDAFADPLMGAISDNARSAHGRRKPFIVAGAILCALFFPACWCIPGGLGSLGAKIWLAGAMLLFYSAYTLFSIPYHALGYESAPGYHAKTRLFGARTLFATLTGFAVAWVFPLTQLGWLGNPVGSARWLAIFIGAVLLLTGLVPALVAPRTARSVPRQRAVAVREGLVLSFRSKAFVRLLGASGLAVIGLNMVNILGTYVNVYYVFGGDARPASVINGWAGTLQNVVVILATPLVVHLAGRWGKHRILAACFGLALCGTVGKWWLYTPAHPWWQMIVILLLAPGMAGLWMLSEAMVGDVSAFEARRTGLRMEGTFGAVFNWVMKSALALGVLVSGFILDFTGFEVSLGAEQSARTVFWIRFLFAFLPTAALVGSLLLIRRYPLDQATLRASGAE